MSVTLNTTKAESILKRKSDSVHYQTVHKLATMGKSLVGHIPSNKNDADLMTQVTCGQICKYLVSNIPYDVLDDH